MTLPGLLFAPMVSARDIFGRPDFFDQGQEQLEQEVQRMQQQPSDSVLTVKISPPQWQPIVSKSGRFSVWMPPGYLSQETHVLQTKAGAMDFAVLASQLGNSRYVVAYADLPSALQQQSSNALFDAAKNRITASTSFKLISDRPISLNNNPGREFKLSGSNEITTYRMYRAAQVIYVIGSTEKSNAPAKETTTFFNSFQILK